MASPALARDGGLSDRVLNTRGSNQLSLRLAGMIHPTLAVTILLIATYQGPTAKRCGTAYRARRSDLMRLIRRNRLLKRTDAKTYRPSKSWVVALDQDDV